MSGVRPGVDGAACMPSPAGDGGVLLDKHQRNGLLGHVLSAVEAQLSDLRCF
jgi:hypothetical protein